jgi:hypothetical protein
MIRRPPRSTHRIIELAAPSDLGRSNHNLRFDGLRVLVVALGYAHGPGFLAIS